MLVLVSGGSASGKSAFAEGLAVDSLSTLRYYIATMMVWDEESQKRVERHREMRRDKGFLTIEQPLDLYQFVPEPHATVLLEDLSNLYANERYCPGRGEGAIQRVLDGVMQLSQRLGCTIVVTNEVFSDGIDYDPETKAFLSDLARLNCEIARQADQVWEVVVGIPVCHKGEAI